MPRATKEERLQKILSRAGISSRRQAEAMIRAGRVRVNGSVVTELGTKADPNRDRIAVDRRLIRLSPERTYLLLNKPRGVLTTLSDPRGRRTVRDLLGGIRERVYPVGRLDYHSAGLLLLTNDGELAQRLMHPRYGVEKTYHVKVRGQPTEHALGRLSRGIRMVEGKTSPAKVHVLRTREGKSWLELTIAEGKRRQVRRMCEAVGLPVEKLVRVRLGPLKLGKLPPGQYRSLSEDETNKVRRAVGLG